MKTSGRYDVESTTWSTPASQRRHSKWVRNGTPAAGSIGFGVVTVSGRSRVPWPPTSTIASTRLSRARPAGRSVQHGGRPGRGGALGYAGDRPGKQVAQRQPDREPCLLYTSPSPRDGLL